MQNIEVVCDVYGIWQDRSFTNHFATLLRNLREQTSPLKGLPLSSFVRNSNVLTKFSAMSAEFLYNAK